MEMTKVVEIVIGKDGEYTIKFQDFEISEIALSANGYCLGQLLKIIKETQK